MVEVVEKPEERNWPPTAKLALAAVYVALIVVAWWYFADPTRGAYARSDSPDGKYRCVVIGDTQCQFAVFERRGWWYPRELPGRRGGEVGDDSISVTGIGFRWNPGGVTVNGAITAESQFRMECTIKDGKQVWRKLSPSD